MQRIIAVIPTYNEEKTIAGIVREAQKHCDEVIVVDDCSSDKTVEVLQVIGAKYVRHDNNKGQGASTRTGIQTALELGADVIVTLDGDGQHDPSQIPQLLEALKSGDVDAVIGSRFLGRSTTPEYRRFGIRVLTWLLNLGCQPKLSDSLLCFRAFKRSSLDGILIQENGFGFCPEMLVKMRHNKVRIKEISANCTYHADYRQNSTFNPVKLAAMIAWKTILWRLRIEL